MVQKAKKNEEIEKVVNVFQDYIMTSPYIEWLWSDKLGYILMQISIKKQDIGESRIISDADMLCWILLNEMAEDTIQAGGSEHAVFEAEPEELKKKKKTLQPYMNQLPEYTYLYEKLFKVI